MAKHAPMRRILIGACLAIRTLVDFACGTIASWGAGPKTGRHTQIAFSSVSAPEMSSLPPSSRLSTFTTPSSTNMA